MPNWFGNDDKWQYMLIWGDNKEARNGRKTMKGITRTELAWKGKFDENGWLRKVDRTILLFQTVESVNESKADRSF